MKISPLNPPTAAMFGLGAPMALSPAPVSADWSLKLDLSGRGAIGSIVQGFDDVAQCIRIILSTPKGSDPMRPTFGADLSRFVDYPLTTAIPGVVREVTDAIARWEPRVKVTTVSARPAADDVAQLLVNVGWRLNLAGTHTPVQSTSIVLPLSWQGD